MKGYKGMLKDRLIPLWNLALLWCQVKTKWIDLAYDLHVRGMDKKYKPEMCKFIAGHRNSNGIRCQFMHTITRDDCIRANDPEKYIFWKNVESWIFWFARNSLYMKEDIRSLSEKEFRSKWMEVDEKLYKFMFKHSDLL